jgi:hypothetical protein
MFPVLITDQDILYDLNAYVRFQLQYTEFVYMLRNILLLLKSLC